MEENTPPKEYKYKLKAEDFVKLFLADDEEFNLLRDFLLNEEDNGITRSDNFTTLKDTEIIGPIIIKDLSFVNRNLSFEKVETNYPIEISKCNAVTPSSIFSFYFENSNLGSLYISDNSNLKFLFYRCTFKELDVRNTSLSELNIDESQFHSLSFKGNSQSEKLEIKNSIACKLWLFNSKLGKS